MKLFTGKTPSGLRVNVAIAEKGLDVPTQWLNVMEGETRTAEHLARNNLGEVPVLELDDGSYLTESIAICRYLDNLDSQTPLFGRDPLEAARIEMWTRRMEILICGPIADFGRHAFPLFKDRLEQIPAYAESQLRLQDKRWAWLDKELSDGRTFIVDDEFSIADIAGMTALLVSDFAQHPVPETLTHVQRWESAMRGRKGW
ncbi:MAG: glutathione S-transferase family protein [Alphaproteobacteria bacterium]